MPEITIITPTYNREHTLPLVYNSLTKQTNTSFIWMIIDDGSVDQTESLIRGYMKKSNFEIQYYRKENGGKARAINYALERLFTKYCVCLDSDDTFSPNAVEDALNLLNQEENNDKCCGIIGLRHNPDNTVMGGTEIPKHYKYITIMDIYNDCNIRSEFITFYKTEIVKEYRFPEIAGEKFMPPSWFHYTLCENYKFRVISNVLCYCEYMGDGLTKNKRKVIVNNPIGYTLIKRISFKHSIGFKRKMKNGIMYVCGCILSRDSDWLKNAPYKMITLFCYPIAVGVYLIRFKK